MQDGHVGSRAEVELAVLCSSIEAATVNRALMSWVVPSPASRNACFTTHPQPAAACCAGVLLPCCNCLKIWVVSPCPLTLQTYDHADKRHDTHLGDDQGDGGAGHAGGGGGANLALTSDSAPVTEAELRPGSTWEAQAAPPEPQLPPVGLGPPGLGTSACSSGLCYAFGRSHLALGDYMHP
eukprot:scaffold96046_cov45-Phaeocystis_antarctica.AAC.2